MFYENLQFITDLEKAKVPCFSCLQCHLPQSGPGDIWCAGAGGVEPWSGGGAARGAAIINTETDTELWSLKAMKIL